MVLFDRRFMLKLMFGYIKRVHGVHSVIGHKIKDVSKANFLHLLRMEYELWP